MITTVVFGCACSYWLLALQSAPVEMKDHSSYHRNYHRQLLRLSYYEYLLKLCWVHSFVIPISAMNMPWKVLCLWKAKRAFPLLPLSYIPCFGLCIVLPYYTGLYQSQHLHLYSCIILWMQCRRQFRLLPIAEFPAVQVGAKFASPSLKAQFASPFIFMIIVWWWTCFPSWYQEILMAGKAFFLHQCGNYKSVFKVKQECVWVGSTHLWTKSTADR